MCRARKRARANEREAIANKCEAHIGTLEATFNLEIAMRREDGASRVRDAIVVARNGIKEAVLE